MAANTTENEFPSTPVKEVKGNSKKIIDLYVSGKNAYQIALEVYDFQNEEAIARVNAVIAKEFPEV